MKRKYSKGPPFRKPDLSDSWSQPCELELNPGRIEYTHQGTERYLSSNICTAESTLCRVNKNHHSPCLERQEEDLDASELTARWKLWKGTGRRLCREGNRGISRFLWSASNCCKSSASKIFGSSNRNSHPFHPSPRIELRRTQSSRSAEKVQDGRAERNGRESDLLRKKNFLEVAR